MLGFAVPLQSYLGNSGIFPFSLARLLPELAAVSVLLFLGFAGLLALLAKVRLSDRFASLLTAILICVYLETGLLSLGLPELNGGPVPELSSATRIVVDLGVWGVVLAAFVALAGRLRPYLHWISLAVLVLALAAVADVRRPASVAFPPADPAGLPAEGRFVPQPTVVENVRYSPSRNVLVFVLDSLPGKLVMDMVRGNDGLLGKFPGFVAYPRNIGMHECTKRGLPGLVTGRHFDEGKISEGEYPMTMYGPESVVMQAAARGWSVAFSPDLLPYGYTNLPVEKWVQREEKRRSRDVLAILRQSKEVPNLSLFDITAFRISPFCLKGPILYGRVRHAVKGRHSNDTFWGERTLYPTLAGRSLAADERPFLGIFHSWGVHPPWTTDLPTEVMQKLSYLGELMDAYRAKGIYDRSMIVITSDHGLCRPGMPSVEGFPPEASAFLWVKPEGASAPYAESRLGTSHARIAPLVRAALEKPMSPSACSELLRDDDRLYRAMVREGGKQRLREWRGTSGSERP